MGGLQRVRHVVPARDDRLGLRNVPGLARPKQAGADFARHRLLPFLRALFLQPMSMYQKLRGLHLATALFTLVFLLAYGISAVEYAHRKWFTHPEQSTEETRRLAPGITDARVLAREWRGELESIENPTGVLKFRVTTPLGTKHEVNYSIVTGETTVKTTTISFLTTLAWMHHSRRVWAFAAALVSLALLTLGGTE